VDLKHDLTHCGEEYRLRVFKNQLLGIMCKPKRENVTGGWITFHNNVNVSKNNSVNKIYFYYKYVFLYNMLHVST